MRPLLVAALTALAPAAHAGFVVGFEAPSVQRTTVPFRHGGVETFDGRTGPDFTTDFGTGGAIGGRYSGVGILAADRYGGAGGTGQYAVTFGQTGYSLDLTTTGGRGVDYFGFWLSALDGGNMLDFYRAGGLAFTFDPGAVLDAIGGDRRFFGNPGGAFAGQNGHEAYAFVNVFAVGETFDRIVFRQSRGGGYESDNHTVGIVAGDPVPEPSGLLGLGLAAALLARRRRLPAFWWRGRRRATQQGLSGGACARSPCSSIG